MQTYYKKKLLEIKLFKYLQTQVKIYTNFIKVSLIKSNILNWQEFDTYSNIGVKIKINYKLFD